MDSLSLCEHKRSICGSFTLQLQMTTESRVITLHTVLQSSADAWARFAALARTQAAKINQNLDSNQRKAFFRESCAAEIKLTAHHINFLLFT